MCKNIEGITVYVVLDVRTCEVIYKGTSSETVALVTEPGTAFGYGPDELTAHRMASRIVERCEANREAKRGRQ